MLCILFRNFMSSLTISTCPVSAVWQLYPQCHHCPSSGLSQSGLSGFTSGTSNMGCPSDGPLAGPPHPIKATPPHPPLALLCLTQDVTLDVNLSCRLSVWYSFVVPPVPSETLTSTTERQINLMVVVLTPLPIDLMLSRAHRKSRCAASVHK